ncbi:hypothetical protein [Adhaeretor mobilis]|uniref:Chromosome partition protein Smc n=1 Tax=Adhaeretor mobilis TaxID=1930276 RepID=A0A517MRX6_9BACT|nr:hypothetical protein [Adhaeretor mobilis]QDS97630.1 Chromosome partition protein Smc [Adhaeretor mobilis]
MNLLGKIFTVLIMLASFGLMIMAMLVYSTHTNWKEEADALKANLSKVQIENTQLRSKYENQLGQLDAEKQAALHDLSKLESEREAMLDQNASIQDELDNLRQARRGAEALVASTEKNNERLQEEVAGLRTEIRDNQQQRDDTFLKAVAATSQLHTTKGELEQVKERNVQLAQQLGIATSALRENDVDPNAEIKPRVRGLVSATLRDSTGLLIEITVGADDGLKAGQTVEVFRGEKYLGRAEVVKTAPDRAVARVLRKFQQGTIQEDDHVATKLRAS